MSVPTDPGRGADGRAARPIQVWQPVEGRWVRPPPGPFGDHHAARLVIEPRRAGTGPRVLLVGESVAAGYLLAPAHTPADVLADLLPGHDVVDLARTDETLTSLLATLESAAQLEPDVVVLWAGNNWVQGDLARMSPGHPEATHRQALGAALREGGAVAARRWAVQALEDPIARGLAELEALGRHHGWRLVVVVPAVDADGWPHTDPPMLGEVTGASAVVDTHGLLRGTALAPMATPPVQTALRGWAAREAHGLVDVPALVEAGTPGPDGWFLDYCHHTAEGIEAVMRAAATAVQAVSGTPGGLGTPRRPSAASTATAAVGALLHTAHRLVDPGARQRLLRRWRDRALAADPSAEQVLADVVTTRLSRAPAVLTGAQRRNQAGRHRLGLVHGWRPQGLDADVLLALGAGTDPRLAARMGMDPSGGSGVEAWAPGARTWLDQRAAEGRGIGGSGPTGSAVLRALTPTVAVPHLQGEAPAPRMLVARLPSPGTVRLSLGTWSTTVGLGTSWTTRTVVVPPSAAPPGLHPLTLHLPPPPNPAALLTAAITALHHDTPADLHPLHAEIWSFACRSSLRSDGPRCM